MSIARRAARLTAFTALCCLVGCADRVEPEPDAAALDDIRALATAARALTHGDTSCWQPGSLLAHYPMDDLSQGVEDATGRGNDGTATNVTTVVVDPPRGAGHFDFNGTPTSFVDLGVFDGLAPENHQFAIGFWVKRDRGGTAETVIGAFDTDAAGRGWSIGFDADDRIVLEVVSDMTASPPQYVVRRSMASVPTGTWTHVVVNSLEAGWGRDIWVDGERAGSEWVEGVTTSWPTLTTATNSSQPLTIGFGLDGSDSFDGQLDDLVIAQSYGFSPAEVALLVDGTTDANPMACGTCDVQCATGGVCDTGVCEFRNCGPEVTAAWSFDEGSGVIAAEPVNMWHAVGVPGWTATGHFGGAAQFDSDDSAIIDAWVEQTEQLPPFTVSAWVEASTDTTWRRIAGRRVYDGTGWELALDEAGALVFALQSGWDPVTLPLAEVQTTSSIPTGTWTHVAATWDDSGDATGMHLYVNGVPWATTTSSDALSTFGDFNAPLDVGGTPGGPGFNGAIDEVTLFNVALSASDIAALHATPTPVCTPTDQLACTGTMASCDGRAWTGCETDLATDDDNCGRCGNVCATGTCDDRACNEDLTEDCYDGVDNDGDGDTDCADYDCDAWWGCRRSTAEHCFDGVDNDALAGGDLDDPNCTEAPCIFADCADSDCAGDPACAGLFERNCFDGSSDDDDTLDDDEDPDCQRVGGRAAAEAWCNDQTDNDDDGYQDCADDDCQGSAHCGATNAETSCIDGVDNDHDGLVDCDDNDCDAFGRCTATWELDCDNGVDDDGDGNTDCADNECLGRDGCPSASEQNEQCWDGIDNDFDGNIDWQDVDCVTDGEYWTLCTDGIDNDDDGPVDCADPDCASYGACSGASEWNCDDGLDDETVLGPDGLIDCEDRDCWAAGWCHGDFEYGCDNEADDDGDSFVDCADPDCNGHWACGGEDCENGVDDDGDTLVDCHDLDCHSYWQRQGPHEDCQDPANNDGDEYEDDCADPDCMNQPPCAAADPEANCSNWSDDNNDGPFDCLDASCSEDPACALTGTGPPGSPCTTGADCATGSLAPACLDEQTFGIPMGMCTAWCEVSAPSCPNGLYCVPSEEVPAVGLCLPRCLTSADCPPVDYDNDGTDDLDLICRHVQDGPAANICRTACAGVTLTTPCSVSGSCDHRTQSCTEVHETCDNGDVDDDGDGLADCLDSDCWGIDGCFYPTEVNCQDGYDNDNDGDTDCADSECAGSWRCTGAATETWCNDLVDNDGDGHADCADSECATHDWCALSGETHCDDGIDNDDFGGADCQDPRCATHPTCQTTSEADCMSTQCVDTDCTVTTCCIDGFDNDGDGDVDCNDSDCAGIHPSCQFHETNCSDFDDSDGDGAFDCWDSDCEFDPSCADGTAALGATCSAHADCQQGGLGAICFMPPGAPSGNCIQGCLLEDGNPCSAATGFSCVDVGFGGGQGICMPACLDDLHCNGIPDTHCEPFLHPGFGICSPDCIETGAPGDPLLCQSPYECSSTTGRCQLSSETDCVEGNCCDGGVDDDLDGLVDCYDDDCFGIDPPCPVEVCDDGFNNDHTPEADCDDPACATDPACFEYDCTDGLDNDEDGQSDCLDPDCASESYCVDADTENLDGRLGLGAACQTTDQCSADDGPPLCWRADPLAVDGECLRGCGSLAWPCDIATGYWCTDIDDGRLCVAPENCTDGIDNDGDGFTDCIDPQCESQHVCIAEDCEGETDLDGDGYAECEDPDECYGIHPSCPAEICDDPSWQDEDGDGDANCRDLHCYGIDPACPEEDCDNGFPDAGEAPDCFHEMCMFSASHCYDGGQDEGDGILGSACTATSDCAADFGPPFCPQMGAPFDLHCVHPCDPDADPGTQCTGNASYQCVDVSDPGDDGGGFGLCLPKEVCDDGQENEWDGLVDCADLECWGHAACDCGDGVVDAGEACDDANTDNDDGCTQWCQPPTCGDGLVSSSLGEQCDDGNTDDGDGCSSTCLDEENCEDGVDNDGDDLPDCFDSDCSGEWFCDVGAQDGRYQAGGGCGRTSDCSAEFGLPLCADLSGTGSKTCFHACDVVDAACGDQGQTCWAADLEVGVSALLCSEPWEICWNGKDDDGDGPPDCLDDDCTGDAACTGGTGVLGSACGTTSDCDPTGGLPLCPQFGAPSVDGYCTHTCGDGPGEPDCQEAPGFGCHDMYGICVPVEVCGDGVDNDLDMATDCDDDGCMADTACTDEQDCDGWDDTDSDGLIGCLDDDCSCSTGSVLFGGECAQHSDCTAPSGTVPFCIDAAEPGVPGTCSYSCVSATACPVGYDCSAAGSGDGVCALDCFGDGVWTCGGLSACDTVGTTSDELCARGGGGSTLHSTLTPGWMLLGDTLSNPLFGQTYIPKEPASELSLDASLPWLGIGVYFGTTAADCDADPNDVAADGIRCFGMNISVPEGANPLNDVFIDLHETAADPPAHRGYLASEYAWSTGLSAADVPTAPGVGPRGTYGTWTAGGIAPGETRTVQIHLRGTGESDSFRVFARPGEICGNGIDDDGDTVTDECGTVPVGGSCQNASDCVDGSCFYGTCALGCTNLWGACADSSFTCVSSSGLEPARCIPTAELGDRCGDGVVQPTLVEQCDAGALNSDVLPDSCRTNCLLPTCGDGVVDAGEECDDGNTVGGDACPATCLHEDCSIAGDEDGDGYADCADFDCEGLAGCEHCSNGADDDADGAFDCLDDECVVRDVCILGPGLPGDSCLLHAACSGGAAALAPACLRQPDTTLDGTCAHQCDTTDPAGTCTLDCVDIGVGNGVGFCINSCGTDAECAAGRRCEQVPGTSVGACVLGCVSDDNCAGGLACDITSGDCMAPEDVPIVTDHWGLAGVDDEWPVLAAFRVQWDPASNTVTNQRLEYLETDDVIAWFTARNAVHAVRGDLDGIDITSAGVLEGVTACALGSDPRLPSTDPRCLGFDITNATGLDLGDLVVEAFLPTGAQPLERYLSEVGDQLDPSSLTGETSALYQPTGPLLMAGMDAPNPSISVPLPRPAGPVEFDLLVRMQIEQCSNGVDDDDDGRVDEECRDRPEGDTCGTAFDCLSGSCSAGTCDAETPGEWRTIGVYAIDLAAGGVAQVISSEDASTWDVNYIEYDQALTSAVALHVDPIGLTPEQCGQGPDLYPWDPLVPDPSKQPSFMGFRTRPPFLSSPFRYKS